MGANAAHVIGHQAVAAFGHHGHGGGIPCGGGTNAHKFDPQGISDAADLVQMVLQFRRNVVDRRQGRAGKFKLPAGFQRDICAIARHADDVFGLMHRGPAELCFQGGKHGRD